MAHEDVVRPGPDALHSVDIEGRPDMDERASEHVDELEVREEVGPRPVYTTPRLTRWGAIPRVTQAFDQDSALPA